MTDTNNKIFLVKGALGGLVLLVVYFFILSFSLSFSHAILRLTEMWYWILPLVVGFSLQVGLYFFVRNAIRLKKIKNPTATVGATAGVSAGAMVACCAHHLVDILPILGLSATFLFLSEYQTLFIIFGILSNIVAIVFMIEIIKKHSLYNETGLLNKVVQFNIKIIRDLTIASAVLILLFSFLMIKSNNTNNVNNPIANTTTESPLANTITLSKETNSGGGLSIDAEPINFIFGEQVKFKIDLSTHKGDLDFDLTKKAILIDANNNEYTPLEWEGGNGGHHLSGILIFPAIKKTENMKLIISDVYDVEEREFMWNLSEI